MLSPSSRRGRAVCAVVVLALFSMAFRAWAQRPTTAVAASPPVATLASTLASDADIIRDGQGSLVFVEGTHGAGSGFIGTMGTQKFLFTNAHVLAGNLPVTLTLLDGSPIRVGATPEEPSPAAKFSRRAVADV